MRMAGWAAIVLLTTSGTAYAQARGSMAAMVQQIDESFVCPEALPDDSARSAELNAMARKMAAKGLTHDQGMSVLRAMLVRHRCEAAAPPVEVAETAPRDDAAPVVVAAATLPR